MIRDALASDLPAITALYGREVAGGTASFELEPPSAAEMTARFEAVRAKRLPWIVAEADGAFAGYAYLSPFRPRAAYRYGVEGSIYVAETARGRGVGRTLLKALIERARALGLRHVIGVVSESASSAASIALHEAVGFRRVGTFHQVGRKFDRWLDVTMMQLNLSPDGDPPRAAPLEAVDQGA